MDQMDYGAVLPPSLMVFLFSKMEGFPWSLLLQRCLFFQTELAILTDWLNRPLQNRTNIWQRPGLKDKQTFAK